MNISVGGGFVRVYRCEVYSVGHSQMCQIIRCVKNLSLTDVAKRVGVSPSTVSRYESGKLEHHGLRKFYNSLLLRDETDSSCWCSNVSIHSNYDLGISEKELQERTSDSIINSEVRGLF